MSDRVNADAHRAGRRSVLRAACGGLLALSLQGLARVGFAAEPAVSRVRGPFVLVSGLGGNVLVRATETGQLLVDSGAAEHGGLLVETLSALPGAGRIEALFNSHWHLDQVGANHAFGGLGVPIIAHEKTRLRVSTPYYLPQEDRYRAPIPAEGRPTETFHTRGSAELDGAPIEYGYLLEAHTDGDIFVYFRDDNVCAVGDAVSPEKDPEIDWFGGGWIGGRVDSLALLLEISDADTLFVPSYGPVVGRAEVQAEHDMMLALFDRTAELLRQGYSADDMLSAGVLDGLPRRFDDPAKFLYDVHKSLWAHHNTLSHDIV
jgi:glyoxylase-like metal-dependent hydrolase (beta-lactamase superfamily II)